MVKQLVLALPKNRLATLLSQQKFEEAEAFAKKFDLDPEVSYRCRGCRVEDYRYCCDVILICKYIIMESFMITGSRDVASLWFPCL